jgi:hypothetical protein
MHDTRDPLEEKQNQRYPDDGKLHPTLSEWFDELLEALKGGVFLLTRYAAGLYMVLFAIAYGWLAPADRPAFLVMPDADAAYSRIGLAAATMLLSWYAERWFSTSTSQTPPRAS